MCSFVRNYCAGSSVSWMSDVTLCHYSHVGGSHHKEQDSALICTGVKKPMQIQAELSRCSCSFGLFNTKYTTTPKINVGGLGGRRTACCWTRSVEVLPLEFAHHLLRLCSPCALKKKGS